MTVLPRGVGGGNILSPDKPEGHRKEETAKSPPLIRKKTKMDKARYAVFVVCCESDSPRQCLIQLHQAVVVFMAKDQPENSCFFLTDFLSRCRRRKQCGHRSGQSCTPLSSTCCNSRFRVCSINGDRRTCARMANLGLLPGCELELLCRGKGQQCMIKINGGTISLDAPTAASIMVAPL